jgi:hypothetical protein
MSNIDKVFCNVELDQNFPLASIKALPRMGSDHMPILWESGCGAIPRAPLNISEKWWLMRGEFKTLARHNWALPFRGGSSIDIT